MEYSKVFSLNQFSQTFVKTVQLLWNNFKGLFITQTILLVILSLLQFTQPALLALVINQLTQSTNFDFRLGILLGLLVFSSVLPSFLLQDSEIPRF